METLIIGWIIGVGTALGVQWVSDVRADRREAQERRIKYVEKFVDLAARGGEAVVGFMAPSATREGRAELNQVRLDLNVLVSTAELHLNAEQAARCQRYASLVDHEMWVAADWRNRDTTAGVQHESPDHRAVQAAFEDLRKELVATSKAAVSEAKEIGPPRIRGLLKRRSRPD